MFKHISHIRPNQLSGYALVPMWPDNRGRTVLSYLINLYSFMHFQAEKRNLDMQELNRFLHYYTRFRNHENSYKLEEPLMKRAPAKMRKLACHSETKGKNGNCPTLAKGSKWHTISIWVTDVFVLYLVCSSSKKSYASTFKFSTC